MSVEKGGKSCTVYACICREYNAAARLEVVREKRGEGGRLKKNVTFHRVIRRRRRRPPNNV